MRSLVKFFSLTFILSWTLWIAAAFILQKAASTMSAQTPISGLPFLMGTFAPALVALLLTAQAEGRSGTLALLRRVIQFPQGVRWYVFAVAYFALVKLTVALLYRVATGAWPAFCHIPVYLLMIAIVVSTPVQAGEEIGWRGYALPRLARHLGLAPASLLLGVIWASWHLPFFFIPGSDNSGQSFPVYLLAVTALSIPMAWLYWRTNGSLLLTMLMHSAINNTAGIVASSASTTSPFSLRTSLVAWLTAAVLWLFAVYFLIRMRRATLQRDTNSVNEVSSNDRPARATVAMK